MTVFMLSVGRFAIGVYVVQPTHQENSISSTGHIEAQEHNYETEEAMSIIYERADILHYEDRSPYIHDILANKTDKHVVETAYGMLVYNQKGSRLKLRWNFLDSSIENSYENLIRTKNNILFNQTEDFEEGTVWNNPDHEGWLQDYGGGKR